jgi:steroid delta-isomerase-like uncharacterized protein
MQATEANKETVRRLYEEIINNEQVALLTEIIDQDFSGAGIGKGSSGFAQTVSELRQGFPDIHFTIKDMVAEGDKVVVRWSWTGTHNGPFKGIPASGKFITNDANVIYQFREGKIIHSWIQSDRLGVLQQIGVTPSS